MNQELRTHLRRLEGLRSDALDHSLSLSRQIHLLRTEKEQIQKERDQLCVKLRAPETSELASGSTLAELDVRIAELKGVCLYYPAASSIAARAQDELRELEQRRIDLLNPRHSGRRPFRPVLPGTSPEALAERLLEAGPPVSD
jgi:hypothetical protein